MTHFSSTTEIALSKLIGRPVSGKKGSADRGANARVPGLGTVRGAGDRQAGVQRSGGSQPSLRRWCFKGMLDNRAEWIENRRSLR